MKSLNNPAVKKGSVWATIIGSLGLAGFQTLESKTLLEQNQALTIAIVEQAREYSQYIAENCR